MLQWFLAAVWMKMKSPYPPLWIIVTIDNALQVAPPLLPVAAPSSDLQYSKLEAGLKFSPQRSSNAENVTQVWIYYPLIGWHRSHDLNSVFLLEEGVLSASLGLGRIAGRNLDLCYFLGNDIFTSHVPCNPNWGDGTNEGVNRWVFSKETHPC